MKVLRKILKMKTTFVDRANTNQKVFETANRNIREGTDMKKKTKLVVKFGRAYRNSRLKRLARIVRASDADLEKNIREASEVEIRYDEAQIEILMGQGLFGDGAEVGQGQGL